jgi:hypothetical protein
MSAHRVRRMAGWFTPYVGLARDDRGGWMFECGVGPWTWYRFWGGRRG